MNYLKNHAKCGNSFMKYATMLDFLAILLMRNYWFYVMLFYQNNNFVQIIKLSYNQLLLIDT